VGFMDVWGFDPEQISSPAKSSDHELASEGTVCNIDEDDALEIPADTSAQVCELWRMFEQEQGL
jgi:hypothetical protein